MENRDIDKTRVATLQAHAHAKVDQVCTLTVQVNDVESELHKQLYVYV
jgi:hypothetical protein